MATAWRDGRRHRESRGVQLDAGARLVGSDTRGRDPRRQAAVEALDDLRPSLCVGTGEHVGGRRRELHRAELVTGRVGRPRWCDDGGRAAAREEDDENEELADHVECHLFFRGFATKVQTPPFWGVAVAVLLKVKTGAGLTSSIASSPDPTSTGG